MGGGFEGVSPGMGGKLLGIGRLDGSAEGKPLGKVQAPLEAVLEGWGAWVCVGAGVGCGAG